MAEQLNAFVWNPYTRQFVTVSGKPVDTEALRKLVDEIRKTTGARLNKLARSLQDGSLTNLAEFSLTFKEEMKNLYLTTHILAKGGVEQMAQSDWGKVGAAVKDQYDFVNKMVRDVDNAKIGVRDAEGKVIVRDSGIPELGDDFIARADMYTQSSWGAAGEYENAVRDRELDLGSLERRVLGASQESCDDCIEQADMGWQPPGVLANIGETACGPGCNCTFEFENTELQALAEEFAGGLEKGLRRKVFEDWRKALSLKRLLRLDIMDDTFVTLVFDRLAMFEEEFPAVASMLELIGIAEDREYALAYVVGNGKVYALMFNSLYWTNPADLQDTLLPAIAEDVTSTYPIDTPESTIDHEFAHLLDDWLQMNAPEGQQLGSDNPVWKTEAAEKLTRYSKVSPSEAYAEAFALRQAFGIDAIPDQALRDALATGIDFAAGRVKRLTFLKKCSAHRINCMIPARGTNAQGSSVH